MFNRRKAIELVCTLMGPGAAFRAPGNNLCGIAGMDAAGYKLCSYLPPLDVTSRPELSSHLRGLSLQRARCVAASAIKCITFSWRYLVGAGGGAADELPVLATRPTFTPATLRRLVLTLHHHGRTGSAHRTIRFSSLTRSSPPPLRRSTPTRSRWRLCATCVPPSTPPRRQTTRHRTCRLSSGGRASSCTRCRAPAKG